MDRESGINFSGQFSGQVNFKDKLPESYGILTYNRIKGGGGPPLADLRRSFLNNNIWLSSEKGMTRKVTQKISMVLMQAGRNEPKKIYHKQTPVF